MPEQIVKLPAKLQGLARPSRYKFIRGGRGSGKSWSVARALLVLGAQETHRVLCAREVQLSIKQSVHQLLRDQIEALGLSGFYSVLSDEIRGHNGTQISFRGLSDMTAETIKSFEGCTRVWLEEAQTISARSWKILTPTIRTEGSVIWATYNPELDSDETHIRAVLKPHPETWSVQMNWRDNPWFPEVLEKERKHALTSMSDDEYAHVWEGQCRPAVEGAIYAGEMALVAMQNRVTKVSHDPLLKTHAIWDLGFNDSMSIIVAQRAASEVRIIDYIEDSHRAIPEYVRDMAAMQVTWANDWMPHDGFATRYETGKSGASVLEALGRTPIMTPNVNVEEGIRTARMFFPRVWFSDNDNVKTLLECLKRYRRNVSKQTGEPGTPRHDQYSHGADAFRYLSLVADQMNSTSVRKAPRPAGAPLTLGWMG
jgi:phage terminase large subunit